MSRSLKLTLPSIERHVFKVLSKSGIDYDIFWYTSLARVVDHPRKREKTSFIHPPEVIDPLQVRLLNVCRFSMVDQDAVRERYMEKFFAARGVTATNKQYDQWGDNYHSVGNVMVAYHTQVQVQEMIEAHMVSRNFSYTAIMAIRPDTAMVKDTDIAEHMPQIQRGGRVLWVPDFQHWRGYNDRAAYGTVEAMRLYLRRGLQFRDSKYGGNGETFIKQYAERMDITVNMSKMRVLRVRSDGNIAYPDALRPTQKYMSLRQNDPDLLRCIDYEKQQLNADAC